MKKQAFKGAEKRLKAITPKPVNQAKLSTVNTSVKKVEWPADLGPDSLK